MASLGREGNGFTVQFVGADGKRRSVRLGKVARKQAESFKVRVEELATLAALGQSPGLEVAKWLARLSDAMHDRLSRAGLVRPRRATNLKSFLDRQLESRPDLEPESLKALRAWARDLVTFYGDVPLASLTASDLDRLVAHLRATYAPATTARHFRATKCFLDAAVRDGLIGSNPAAHIRCGIPPNTSRRRFIDRATFALVLSAADPDWQTLLCLARYGALRAPSETSLLRWADVAWGTNRLTVTSPKTAKVGKPARVIPLFPELAEALRRAWERAPDGAEFVVGQRLHVGSAWLRRGIQAIWRRAGVLGWPKPMVNLRSSRVTELIDEFPAHVVNAWCGHTEAVSRAHYRQVTEAHFARAVQNPVQHPAEPTRTEAKAEVAWRAETL